MSRRRSTTPMPFDPWTSRRQVLRHGLFGAGLLAGGSLLAACGDTQAAGAQSNIPNLGPLREPDANGIRLPKGFTSRLVARTSEPVANTGYRWPGAPEGAAVFSTPDDGWIHVVNSEIINGAGGASAIRYDRAGETLDAYRILGGTHFNCAGGKSSDGYWLSCEEDFGGRGAVFQCDPTGAQEALRLAAMGLFTHEAVADDPVGRRLYMTEDQPDGGFYRFTPRNYPNREEGTLEIARVADMDAVHAGGKSTVDWLVVPDPLATDEVTRKQLPESTSFLGGEGIWLGDGVAYFATKFDNRIYTYDTNDDTLCVLYHAERDGGVLTGVDNVTVADTGEVLVAEDGGDMQLVALVPGDAACDLVRVVPLLQVVGHETSEITGPCFDPSGTRLYFSSQRGPTGDFFGGGHTYEVKGPFRI